MGRLLVFMARILQDDWASRIRAIAVDENAAVLVELNGAATVVGADSAYFLEANSKPEICKRKTPLQFSKILVHRARSGETFDVKRWKSEQGEDYVLSVDGGKVKSTSKNGIY